MIPNRTNIEQLFHSFPSLSRAASEHHLDESTLQNTASLIQWAHNAKLSGEGLQSAYFVATVLNNFNKLPGNSKFDFSKAIKCWDEGHWAALRTWICEFLVANPEILPVYDPDNRRIVFNL